MVREQYDQREVGVAAGPGFIRVEVSFAYFAFSLPASNPYAYRNLKWHHVALGRHASAARM
jgi:hypothetical protein